MTSLAPGTRWRSVLGLVVLTILAAGAMEAVQHRSHARLGDAIAARARPGDIRMIASIGCVYCAEARAWFAAHRVPFTECLIERDAICADSYRALLAPGTPVFVVKGRRLVGFDPRAVAAALQ